MSETNIHADWLNQIEVTGPFLALPVLNKLYGNAAPPPIDPGIKTRVKLAYNEWREAADGNDTELPELHGAWFRLVLTELLEYDDDIVQSGEDVEERIKLELPEYEFAFRPDRVLVDDASSNVPLLLMQCVPADTPLDEIAAHSPWKVTPTDQFVRLCRATDVRHGLLTNGEQWMFVDVPEGGVPSFASWYARYWIPEERTLNAFASLLGIRRFFGPTDEKLSVLIDESLGHQDEVTEALGLQVMRAIEVLIQKLDQLNRDSGDVVLKDVTPTELYEACLTIMMRLVFLLCAEERGLLLANDEQFHSYYAVSSLRQWLTEQSEEALEKHSDGWSRLLAMFRAVYGGIAHESLRMPALGGSLFDPNRFPFLEGRTQDSDWRTDVATPLAVDNRTVLILLRSIQTYQGRTLSYQSLDVEQIGYVYEGLLERTVVKTDEVTLELKASASAERPWLKLVEIESAKTTGDGALVDLLTERT